MGVLAACFGYWDKGVQIKRRNNLSTLGHSLRPGSVPHMAVAAAAEEGWDGRGDSAQHTLAFQEIFLLLLGLGQMETARSRELLLCTLPQHGAWSGCSGKSVK